MEIQAWAAQQDWGSWADWFAAVGTVGAVAVALAFGLRDGKRLKVEREEAAEDRARFREQQEAETQERKRRLAAGVSMGREIVLNDIGERRCVWTVHNGGDQPISLVALVGRSVVAEGAETPAPFIFGSWPSIEAGGNRAKETALFGQDLVREGDLQFTDGVGLRWQRREYGSLRLIPLGDPETIIGAKTRPFFRS